MKHKTVVAVLSELRRREYCSQQWQRPSATSVAACVGISVSTAQRYLKRLVMFGLVDEHLYDYHGDKARGFTLNNEGMYWLEKAEGVRL